MGNVKYYIFLLILFFLFLIIYPKYSQNRLIKNEKNNIESFISRYKQINALVLGGSNVVNGVSAQYLSFNSNCFFYNLGLSSEGFNFNNYFLYLGKVLPDSLRQRISLVLYSSMHLYDNQFFNLSKNQNLIGLSNQFSIIPDNSIFYAFFNELRASKFPFRKSEFGDLYEKDYPKKNNFRNNYFSEPNLDSLIINLSLINHKFQVLFPNAKIVFTNPLLIQNDKIKYNDFVFKLSIKAHQSQLIFIPFFSDNFRVEYFSNYSHLNQIGRKIHSRNLLDSLLYRKLIF